MNSGDGVGVGAGEVVMDTWSQTVVRRALSWPLVQREVTPEPQTAVCTCYGAGTEEENEQVQEAGPNGGLQLPLREEQEQDPCSQLLPSGGPLSYVSTAEPMSNNVSASGPMSNNATTKSASAVPAPITNQTASPRPSRTPSAPSAPDSTSTNKQRPTCLARQGSAPVHRCSRIPSLFSPGLLSEENSHASHVSHASHLSSHRPGATGENARRFPTIYLHYYPEAGWGWVVATCALLVQLTLVGLHAGAGLVLLLVGDKFPQIPPQELGEYRSPVYRSVGVPQYRCTADSESVGTCSVSVLIR